MTATKVEFTEIIASEGFKLLDAGAGKRWIEYPSGKPVKSKNARYMLYAKKRIYAGPTIDSVVIAAFRDGDIDIHSYGWETCPRCSGLGKLGHYAHVHSGDCFKCRGFGII